MGFISAIGGLIPMELLKYLSIGYVLKPHGIKGELKVEPLPIICTVLTIWTRFFFKERP